MEASRVAEKHSWTMKEAAKEVGVGLPRLYTRLRERGLFTRLGDSGRHIPTRKLQRDGLFRVKGSAFFVNGSWRPCPKVLATFEGLQLLQEIADELEREREKPTDKRSRVRSDSDSGQRPGEVAGDQPGPGAAGSAEPKAGSDGVLREPSPASQPAPLETTANDPGPH